MSEKKTTVSRREFLKDAGLVVGGATIGSAAILSACSKGGTETITKTETKTQNSTVTSTTSVTKTEYVAADGTKFATLKELQDYYAATAPNFDVSKIVSFKVDGKSYTLAVEDWWPLAYVLRDILGYFSIKLGCDMGNCGTCTILVNGTPMFSCLMLASEADGLEITTAEGLCNGYELSPVQKKFYDYDATQCGYCTPGLLLAATALIAENPKPTADDVRYAFSGHLCFCNNMTKQVACMVGGVN